MGKTEKSENKLNVTMDKDRAATLMKYLRDVPDDQRAFMSILEVRQLIGYHRSDVKDYALKLLDKAKGMAEEAMSDVAHNAYVKGFDFGLDTGRNPDYDEKDIGIEATYNSKTNEITGKLFSDKEVKESLSDIDDGPNPNYGRIDPNWVDINCACNICVEQRDLRKGIKGDNLCGNDPPDIEKDIPGYSAFAKALADRIGINGKNDTYTDKSTPKDTATDQPEEGSYSREEYLAHSVKKLREALRVITQHNRVTENIANRALDETSDAL